MPAKLVVQPPRGQCHDFPTTGKPAATITGTIRDTPYGNPLYYPCFPPQRDGAWWTADCVNQDGTKTVRRIVTMWR